MQTTELLKAALIAAQERGFHVRIEKLDGVAPGACHLAGKRVLFLEVAATAREQLAVVLAALREEAAAKLNRTLPVSNAVASKKDPKRVA
jgi:hypothetical protein